MVFNVFFKNSQLFDYKMLYIILPKKNNKFYSEKKIINLLIKIKLYIYKMKFERKFLCLNGMIYGIVHVLEREIK